LIEVLVVVAIIALLVAILMPSLSRAKASARRTVCQSNLKMLGHGVGFYLVDSKGVLPAAQIYGVGGYQRLTSPHLPLGAGIPNDKRPLNRYLKNIDIFECPGDEGDPYFGLPSFFAAHGTSYSYASHVRGDELPPQYQPPSYGIQSCRRHPSNAEKEGLPMGFVKRPVRKIIFMEPPLSPAFANRAAFAQGYPEDDASYRAAYAASPQSHWHSRKQQHGNALFADFHVGFVLFNKEQINAAVLGPGMAPWDRGRQNRRYY